MPSASELEARGLVHEDQREREPEVHRDAPRTEQAEREEHRVDREHEELGLERHERDPRERERLAQAGRERAQRQRREREERERREPHRELRDHDVHAPERQGLEEALRARAILLHDQAIAEREPGQRDEEAHERRVRLEQRHRPRRGERAEQQEERHAAQHHREPEQHPAVLPELLPQERADAPHARRTISMKISSSGRASR
jgi:hypothetical protein